MSNGLLPIGKTDIGQKSFVTAQKRCADQGAGKAHRLALYLAEPRGQGVAVNDRRGAFHG